MEKDYEKMKMEDDSFQGTLTKDLFIKREEELYHTTYDKELSFYQAVSLGDIKKLDEMYNEKMFYKSENGKLSKDPIRNVRYHFLVTLTMITRFCIESGMNEQNAYGLSDIYIRKADEINSIRELEKLHKKMTYEFAHEMHVIIKLGNYSVAMQKALDYIYNHLNESIDIEDIARAALVSKRQLFRIFKEELDTTPAVFVNKKKIESAKNMLLYTELSYVEIANNLSFSSHSHFISIFRKYEGSTPKEYRKLNYRKHFINKV